MGEITDLLGSIGGTAGTTGTTSTTTASPTTGTISANIIVNNEYNRITKKKQDIDDEYNTQKRLLGFNNSFNERYSYYTHMLYVTIIGLVLFILLSVIGSVFPIPSAIINILAIILICVVGGLLINDYYIINGRSNMNFSELHLPAKLDASKDIIDSNVVNDKYNLVGNPATATCVGDKCCDAGTSWSATQGKCIPTPATTTPSPATTTTTASPGAGRNFNTMSGSVNESFETMPNSAFEFSNYSKY